MNFADLRDARPQLWHEAALDFRTSSVLHDDTSDEIHANGVRALEDNWYDALGDLAKGELRKLAEKFRSLGLLDGGAASAMDTLEDAVKIAQRELNDGIYAAESTRARRLGGRCRPSTLGHHRHGCRASGISP